MPEIHDLVPTDASNVGRFPENQAPSSLNNGARALEGMIARWHRDTNFSVVATISASLITITANRSSLTLTGTTSNYIADLKMAFTMGANPNTGPVRVTVNTLGPIELRDNQGVSLTSSVLLAGARVMMVKDASNDYFRLLLPDPTLPDGAVATAKIANNAVDETKLKDALIGDYTEVVVATGDSFLLGDVGDSGNTKRDTIQGVLDLVTIGWNKIGSTQTASNDTSIDFTSGLDSTYDHYVILISNLVPATDDTEIWIRVSVASSFQAGAADYTYAFQSGSANEHSASGGAAQLLLNNTNANRGVGSATGEGASLEIHFVEPDNTSRHKNFWWSGSYKEGGGNAGRMTGAGSYDGATSAIDGVRILMGSGNITSGEFTLYGVTK